MACILTWDVTGRAPDGRWREDRLEPRSLESLWGDLTSAGAPRAHRAAWSLVAGARQAVPFLRERLLKYTTEDKQIGRWITGLDSDDFAARQKATDELAKLGGLAERALREALDANPALEPRRRIERLLKQLPAPAYGRHAARVTHVLEQIGTPEARKVLQSLSKEGSVLGREAKTSLGRIDKPKE
jgi:hypothetical protein